MENTSLYISKKCLVYNYIFSLIELFLYVQGSAKRLIKAALQDAARKREMRYSDLISIDKKVRRHFHDDITVIVVFLNHDPYQDRCSQTGPTLSLRCPLDN